MSLLKALRSAQTPLWAEFTFNLTDTMVDTSGVEKSLAAAAVVIEPIALPPNAVVVGGDMTVETASNEGGAGTHTIAVGDSDDTDRYLAATTIKTAARTALTLTGYRGTGQSIRVTLAASVGDATAGKVTLRVAYTISGRATEVLAR